MKQTENEKDERSFEDISLILTSLFLGMILLIRPFNVGEVLPWTWLNNIVGILLLLITFIGLIGSKELKSDNIILNSLVSSIKLLALLLPFVFIYLIFAFELQNILGVFIQYSLLLLGFFLLIMLFDMIVKGVKTLNFSTKAEVIDSLIKIGPPLVAIGTFIFQIYQYFMG